MKTVKFATLVVLLISIVLTTRAFAHCDSMEGPVIKDAQRYLRVSS